MLSYLVRVELHNAAAEDYDRLHAQLERAGLTREVADHGGLRYPLPTGTYRWEGGPPTALEAAEQVYSLAAEVGRRCEVVAGKLAGIAWAGIEPIPANR